MKEIKLADFLNDHSQEETARIMRLRQSSVSKMARSQRDIRLVFSDEKNFSFDTFSHYAELKIKSANEGEAA